MSKLKNGFLAFLKEFWLSLGSPKWYATRKDVDIETGLKYFVKLSTIVVVFFSLQFLLWGVALIGPVRSDLVANAEKHPDLVIEMDGGQLSTSVDEPITLLSTPKFLKFPWDPDKLIVVDQNVDADSEPAETDALVLFGHEGMWFKEMSKDYTYDLYEEWSFRDANFFLTSDMIKGAAESAWLEVGVLAIALCMFIYFVLEMACIALANLLGAVLVKYYLKFRGTKISFSQAYTLGFYLLTWPMIIFLIVVQIWSIGLPVGPALWIGMVAAYVIAMFVSLRGKAFKGTGEKHEKTAVRAAADKRFWKKSAIGCGVVAGGGCLLMFLAVAGIIAVAVALELKNSDVVSEQDGGFVFTSKDNNFVATFPAQPTRDIATEYLADLEANVTSLTYASTVSDVSYYVVVHQYQTDLMSVDNPDFSVEGALEGGINGMVNSSENGRIISQESIDWQGRSGLKFVVGLDGELAEGMLIYDEASMYVVTVGYLPDSQPSQEDIDGFLNSFSFLE